MVMILIFCEHLFTKDNARKNQSSEHESFQVSLTVPRSHGLVDKRYCQIDSSPCIFLSHSMWGGGGLPQKERGGFSGLSTKPGQPYQTILYTSQGFQIMFWIRCDQKLAKEHIRRYTIYDFLDLSCHRPRVLVPSCPYSGSILLPMYFLFLGILLYGLIFRIF